MDKYPKQKKGDFWEYFGKPAIIFALIALLVSCFGSIMGYK